MTLTILHFLLSITLFSITTNGLFSNQSDQESLFDIKSEISNDPHAVLASWNKSLHFCDWQGVKCGYKHQRVVHLDLRSSDLGGTLSPSIGNLTFLKKLVLLENFFNGSIPHQISSLRRLQVLVLERNSFHGQIPANLSSCLKLKALHLGHNNLTGTIPPSLTTLPVLVDFDIDQNSISGRLSDIGLGNFSSSLQYFFISSNGLEGSVPDDIGRLQFGLVSLGLSRNFLTGKIPSSLFNLSNLNLLDLAGNNFHGDLPQDLGIRLPKLSKLSVQHTSLTGQLPTSISNLSELVLLDISYNGFKGKLPVNGHNSPQISTILAEYAFSSSDGLNFLDSLTNCTSLAHLILPGNSFGGELPSSVVNLSSTLQEIDLGSNKLLGKIPQGLGKFVNLYKLWLDMNYFTNHIPLDFGKMESLQSLVLNNNNLVGEIPSSLGNLTKLSTLQMGYNHLQGSLPSSLGNCKILQNIFLSSNNISGSIPTVLFRASNLIEVMLRENNFEGSLPAEISSLKNLNKLDISQNRFSGNIPATLGEYCTSLTILNLSRNSFMGSIPESFASLKSIQRLDLSSNIFSGQIPNFFSKWPSLSNLNLSFNKLSGAVPTNGVFANTSVISVVGNDMLCGGVLELHLPECSGPKKRLSSKLIMIISITCSLIGALAVALGLYFLLFLRKRKDRPSEQKSINPFLEVSYRMLHTATEGFSQSNLLGIGGFGSVYKGILQQDDKELVVAVKVMNLCKEGATKSFLAECMALRNIRHMNLVKVITACSSIDAERNDFKALVYEFMPRGSLEDWLHSTNSVSEDGRSSLSLVQRLSITIDVAYALEYLHIECANPIVHCDLKPSNILLDDDMIALVGDFGLAKFVSRALNSNSTDQLRGTVGYAAPEYGTGSKVSLEGDMYSLGIIILELMTLKKPTDPFFSNGLNLHDFANASLPNGVMEIIDHKMLGEDEVIRSRNAVDARKRECIKSIIMIGVKCSMEVPQERMKIKDVVKELGYIRKNFERRI